MEKKKLNPQQARQRIYKYCTYQERSHYQVREKLYAFGLWKAEVEEILSELIIEGYLNEQRFANAFAGGKFRMKKWGRLKIIRELEAHRLTANCIGTGLKEISEEDYQSTLRSLAIKKFDSVDEPNIYARRDRVARFLMSKGYEADLVWGVLRELGE